MLLPVNVQESTYADELSVSGVPAPITMQFFKILPEAYVYLSVTLRLVVLSILIPLQLPRLSPDCTKIIGSDFVPTALITPFTLM